MGRAGQDLPEVPSRARGLVPTMLRSSALRVLREEERRRRRVLVSAGPDAPPRPVPVAYYNAEEAFYGQSDEVNFRVHIFSMEGERWARLVEVSFAFPSPDLELRLFVRVFDARDAAAHP